MNISNKIAGDVWSILSSSIYISYLFILFENLSMGNIPEMYARHKAEKEKEKMMENAEGMNPFGGDENDEEEHEEKKNRFGRWRKPANQGS